MWTNDEMRLTELLDSTHQWPELFPFKFIVPKEKAQDLEALFPDAEKTETRPSSGGKYLGYTFYCAMASGREVLSVYARVQGIPGLVSL